MTKAMILAAGKGTRMGPHGLATPKVLMPVGEVPLIFHTFTWLKSHGISQVALNLHHLGSKVNDYVGDGSRFGMEVLYSHEKTLLGTAGAVKKIEHFFDDTFIVIYGDILTDFDLTAMIRFHQAKKAIATLALIEVSDPSSFGIVEIGRDRRVIRFVEKPQAGMVTGKLASAVVYVLDKAVFGYIPGRGFCDFGYDVFPKLLAAGLPVYGYRLTAEDYWIDIGTPEKYHQVNEDVKAGRLRKSTRNK